MTTLFPAKPVFTKILGFTQRSKARYGEDARMHLLIVRQRIRDVPKVSGKAREICLIVKKQPASVGRRRGVSRRGQGPRAVRGTSGAGGAGRTSRHCGRAARRPARPA